MPQRKVETLVEIRLATPMNIRGRMESSLKREHGYEFEEATEGVWIDHPQVRDGMRIFLPLGVPHLQYWA